jgi:hypothetical protein
MISDPILYCLDIEGTSSQICEYQVSSKINDSYYRGFCVLEYKEKFDPENIDKINMDIITQIDSNKIYCVKLNRMGSNDYKDYVSNLETTTFKELYFSRQHLNALQGYSSVDCQYEMYTFTSMKISEDSLVFNVLFDKRQLSEKATLDTIKIKVPKFQARVIQDKGRIIHIQAETLITQTGNLYHYTNSSLDSTSRSMIISCNKTYDFTPYHETIASDYDFSGCFTKRIIIK